MFDIGWTEMAIVALLALIVIGPKDLPKAMQSVGRWVRRARSLTREFQSGLDEMIREAELDDAKKAIEASRNLNLKEKVSEAIDPTGEVLEETREIEATAQDAGREIDAAGRDQPATPPPADDAKVVRHPAQNAAAAETSGVDGKEVTAEGEGAKTSQSGA